MVVIYCEGPRGGRLKDEDEIIRYVDTACAELDIRKAEIDVVVYNKFPKDYYDWLGCCYGSLDEGMVIELTREQDNIYQTLAHEMIHVKQFLTGQYPSERVALTLEKRLHREVCHKLNLDT
tara:strand:- start:858 stop:1220 length:363 start_codon:yes stop_codon:yes gene_type:complete